MYEFDKVMVGALFSLIITLRFFVEPFLHDLKRTPSSNLESARARLYAFAIFAGAISAATLWLIFDRYGVAGVRHSVAASEPLWAGVELFIMASHASIVMAMIIQIVVFHKHRQASQVEAIQ